MNQPIIIQVIIIQEQYEEMKEDLEDLVRNLPDVINIVDLAPYPALNPIPLDNRSRKIRRNVNIKSTIHLTNRLIRNIDLQDWSKYLLRCMRYLSRNGRNFTRMQLENYMVLDRSITRHYRGTYGLDSPDNIRRYWTYVRGNDSRLKIPNFNKYWIEV